MTDVELTRALERGEIKDFHHASHLHVAWVYLAESPSVQHAANKMPIRRGRRQTGEISRDHDIILGASSFLCVCSQSRRTPGRHRACKSAIAGKEFSTRLLFGRAAFQ